MPKTVDVQVKDQYSNVLDATAVLKNFPQNSAMEDLALLQQIEHIVVEGETILPSIELLFESRESDSIYRVVE